MVEIKIDTADPKLRERLTRVIAEWRVDERGTADTVNGLLGALGTPEPVEPAVFQYRDGFGAVWQRDADGAWTTTAVAQVFSWPEAKARITGELVPLWTAAELIPDPDEEQAVWDLAMDIASADSPRAIRLVAAVCRVLRARIGSRVPTGGADGV